MIGRLEWLLLELRRRISRNEWMARLLRLPTSEGTEAKPGLVLIQIDGLSRRQLDRALQQGNMPFLHSLIRREGYRCHALYSGLPSNTPAFQGELFYGVKGVVPAFGYQRQASKQLMSLYEPSAAAYLQEILSKEDVGLLNGGSSYCNVYSGGAEESHYCPATLGWSSTLRASNPLTLSLIILLHGWSVIRVGVLLLLESALAVIDCIRGLIQGQDLLKELKFVPTRVAICVLLRELVTIGATVDTARGLPVIHLNYLGYDEQAHRRGPDSAFAHWSLKGIDDAAKRVWQAARRSARRDYEVWIFSDHGQEQTIPYEVEYGRSIQDAVDAVINRVRHDQRPQPSGRGIQLERITWLGGPMARWLFRKHDRTEVKKPSRVLVTALGPLGHIYIDRVLAQDDRDRLARLLVEEANIPLVLVPEAADTARAWTAAGEFTLPVDAKHVLGERHPFLNDVAQDLVALCHHPDAGTYIISGWRPNATPISFPIENGAHAGPGNDETGAFALLPGSASLHSDGEQYLRPLDLREGVLHALGRSSAVRPPRRRGTLREKQLRVMTYNVHRCVGMDGKVSPERIAKVISHYDPDVVALQELDVGRRRTGGIDQAHRIAEILEMEFHFHPAMEIEEEKYGDAILSRYPLRLMRADHLPTVPSRLYLEPRGALWVSMCVEGSDVQLMNTHLGLFKHERIIQTEALLGPEWLTHPDCRQPIILCGDFNALPGSVVCQKLNGRLRDAQRVLLHHQPKGTWFGRYPIHRIDHVFVDSSIDVLSVEVPRTALTRTASDHLPLIVDVSLT